MFLKFWLGQHLTNKRNLSILIILPLLVVGLCFVVEQSAKDKTKVYRGAIIDQDQSYLSNKLTEDMKSYTELQIDSLGDIEQGLTGLRRNKYDVVYVIAEGFEASIKQGKMHDLLYAHSMVDTPSVKWVNDQVSLRVMRLWSYYDILQRIRQFSPDYSESAYDEVYQSRQQSNEILRLQVHYENKPSVLSGESIGSRVFFLLWLYLIAFFSLGSVGKITEQRLSGLRDRLVFSGIKKKEYLLTFVGIHLLLIFFLIGSSLLWAGLISFGNMPPVLDVSPVNGLVYTCVALLYGAFTWGLFAVIGRFSKTIASYTLTAQFVFLLMVIGISIQTDLTFLLL